MKKPTLDRAATANPAWTRAEIATARPALDLIAETLGADLAESLRRPRGRPRATTPKINQTLRLDADVLEAYRRDGPGWQTRINAVLRANKPE